MNRNRTLQLYLLNGIFFTIMQNLYKPFAVKFLERIGGDAFYISLYNALPGLIAACITLPGALWLQKKHAPTRESVIFLGSRLFVGCFALVPFAPAHWQPILFVLLIGFMNLPDSLSQMIIQELPARYFTDRDRSVAIAKRNQYSVPALLIVTLVSGQILSYLPKTESQRLLIYQLFFIVSFVFGVLEVISFSKLSREKSMIAKNSSVIAFLPTIKKIFQNKKFLRFFGCSLLFHFGWQMGWSLFSIYQIEVLGANEWWMGLISISSATAMFFSYRFWSKQILKHGNTPILGIVTIGMAVTPLLYVASKDLYTMTFLSLITGIFTSGTVTVLQNTLLEVSPTDNRILYIGVYQTVINISLMTAPMVGHEFLQLRGIVFALCMTSFFRILGSISFFIRYKKLKHRGLSA
jgi:Na+/melibiose symporter-like transporter